MSLNKKFRKVYLDHAATTPVDPRVKEHIQPYFTDIFGNPSSIYAEAQKAKKALDDSRMIVSEIFGCGPDEIIFTSGGTESDNMAILGTARANKSKGNHIITSKIEHHAVLNTCRQLEREGFDVTYVNVDKNGIVYPDEVKKAVTENTILISIMYANNEIGTIQPIAKIGRMCKKRGIPFHTDACQATGYLPLNVDKLHLDLMTINGSKMYGPKGAGVLYIREGTEIQPIIYGGGQEKGLRPGTENVPAIAGLSKALEIAQETKDTESQRLIKLRDYMIERVLNEIPKTSLNGHPEKRLPNNVNISFSDIEGEALLLRLDMEGIEASSGSACTSGSLDPSHVILALGAPYETAHGSIRFTLGKTTKKHDIDYVIEKLKLIVKELREISPLNM